ncbi:MAG TPA: helix-turn-helix domain-containing protein [Actinophytocola sp.]|uniref:PucR family transcriptional regulator n=1 Tax=Actinophytocola sp. TaxID=1872138 RepID=UPI002DB60BBB|nr:helix-turn-helix domain-containing protein [Actinophytocola sp.]HEU5474370.1 helix-turn-helix domain-containing protein [Actinophytocola sp.]
MVSLRVVDAYGAELPDYRRIVADPRARAELVELMVFARGRTVDLATEGGQFTDDDLETIAAGGRVHGAAGISPAAQRRAVLIHTKLTLRELYGAAGSHDIDNLMRVLRWYAPQSRSVQAAYARGFLRGQQAHLPDADRVRVLAGLLLAGDAMAAQLAISLAMTVPARCVVLVVRTPPARPGHADPPRAEVVADLLARHWMPMSWETPAEFVALVGADGPVSAEDRALAVARDFGQLVELPCAVGAAVGDTGELAGPLAQARQVCRVAPLDTSPGTVHYRTDLFAELGVARVPPVEAWLRDVADRLAAGPNLVPTLAAFYRTDMSRMLTAATLGIHPRTLDYRLRRAHEVTGLDPVSVRGVRILSTAVTRALAGAWT